jgi:hypothetical protein
MNYKLQRLLHEGFSMGTLEKLSNGQLNLLYGKIMEQAGVLNVKKDSDDEDKAKAAGKSFVTYEEELEEDGVYALNRMAKVDPYETGKNYAGPGSDDGFGDEYDGMSTESEIYEKAVSKKQRGLMGAAYSVEKGYKKMSDIPKSYRGKVKDVVKSMTKKQIKDFASTSDDELKEGFSDIFFRKQKREIESMMMDADAKYEETGNCHYVVDGSWGKFVSDEMPSNEEQVFYDTCEEEEGNLEEGFKDYFFKKDDSEFDRLVAEADNMYEETGNCHYVIDGNYGMYVTDDMTENEDKVVYDTCEDEVGNLEESILNIIQKHIPPHFTKKELLRNYRNRI